MAEDIPLFNIDWGRSEVLNAVDSITRGGYWAKGPFVDEFEAKLESYLGVEHAVTVNSGTTALVTALTAAGIGDGDEVIVPSFTFIATANAVRLCGAEPIFADVEPERYGLDPTRVEKRIGPDTAAILPIHCYGVPCKIEQLRRIADEHGLVLVEDAAEAFGATADGELAGTVGDVSALSFCQNKVIATGEGGAVVTDDDEIARAAALVRSHGRRSEGYFDSTQSGEYVTLGSNYRMADVVAAIGSGQMDRIEEIIDARRTAARTLTERLRPIEGVTPPREPSGTRHVYQIYTVELADPAVRDDVIATLDERGIASKVYWDPPVHRTQYYQRGDALGDDSVSDRLSRSVLSLPMYPGLDEGSIDRIATAVAHAT